jgi:tetratricopeptide (TPR) repeat protein
VASQGSIPVVIQPRWPKTRCCRAPTLPRANDIAIDGRVLAFTPQAATETVLAFGVLPASPHIRPRQPSAMMHSRLASMRDDMCRRSKVSFGVLLLWAGLSGCFAHEKAGDGASAVGDWRKAFEEYRSAVRGDPSNVRLQEKFQRSRAAAVSQALAKGRGCVQSREYECALAEANYALAIDEGNSDVRKFRDEVARGLAFDKIERAKESASRSSYLAAYRLLDEAVLASRDVEVSTSADTLRIGMVAGAVEEARRLATGKSFKDSIDLLAHVVRADGSQRGVLETIQHEYEAHSAAEYERFATAGDQLLASKDWRGAEASYRRALEFKSGGRAASRLRYSDAVLRAEGAVSRRDFSGAASGYKTAISTGEDGGGHAATALESVVVRPYRFRIRSVLVSPQRPDGAPWVGQPNHAFLKGAASFAALVPSPDVQLLSKAVGALARWDEAMPRENKPTLVVDTELPDGRQLRTPPKRGIYVTYDGQFVLETNAYDARQIHLAVHHVRNGDSEDDVGTLSASLGDIVAKRAGRPSHSLLQVEMTSEAVAGGVDGSFSGLELLSDGDDEGPAASRAVPGARGYRIQEIRLLVPPGGYDDEFGVDGAPDPFVQILQGSRVVFQTSVAKDVYQTTWRPRASFIFAADGEALTIRAWDKDLSDDDLVLRGQVLGSSLGSEHVRLTTAAGTTIEVVTRRRAVGPE